MPLIVGRSFLFQCFTPQSTIRLVETEFTLTLPSRFKGNGSIAQLNRASDYGSEGWGFESLWDHGLKSEEASNRGLFFIFHSAFRTVLLLPTARFRYSQSLKSVEQHYFFSDAPPPGLAMDSLMAVSAWTFCNL